MKNNLKLVIIILFMSLFFVLTNLIIYIIPFQKKSVLFKNEVEIASINLVSKNKDMVKVAIIPSKEEKYCSIDNAFFVEMQDNICTVLISKKGDSVYFKDEREIISKPLKIDNYILDIQIDDIYYLSLESFLDLKDAITYIGNKKLSYNYDKTIIDLLEDEFVTLKSGETILEIKYNDVVIKTSKIIVSDLIKKPNINARKKSLGCKIYNEKQAEVLDEILASRIKKAGKKTRAGVVAAARFLTLEFPYRIPYFYENGRLHESSPHRADGEGRYYHVGLYLHKTKFSSIIKKVAGPAIWGCGLTNYEPNPPNYIPLEKMPNGLDCSGFVSWAILNGGYDIGDLGAGPTDYNYELPDTGEFIKLTKELITSNIIKPGDLLSMSGHIAIIIGIDENNIYVAESLPRFRGVVANVYSKSKINKTFSHVVLMDLVYGNDGNLTYMW